MNQDEGIKKTGYLDENNKGNLNKQEGDFNPVPF